MSSKTSTEINNEPVIGILTLPLSNWLGDNIALDSRRANDLFQLTSPHDSLT